jgi:hypothetical protein
MKDITMLHPKFIVKLDRWVKECAKQGIYIKIGTCVRTEQEQNTEYAKGRTAPGIIVTNCKGSTFSSMHQWFIAADFYLDMDIDKDGKKSDDAFNDKTGMFRKAGKIAESVGLEWGGDWKTIIDKPHVQLPDWGSTAVKLRQQYKTPEQFRKTWLPVKQSITPTSNGLDIAWAQDKLTKLCKGCKMKVDKIYGTKTEQYVLAYYKQLKIKPPTTDGSLINNELIYAMHLGRKE